MKDDVVKLRDEVTGYQGHRLLRFDAESETESLFYFCIGTKVSFRGEKSKFWWGESSYLSANAFTEI